MTVKEVIEKKYSIEEYSVEKSITIWNNSTSNKIVIGPSKDGPEFVKISMIYSDSSLEEESITVGRKEALLIANAIKELLK